MNHVSSEIIRHNVVAFVCLHFCLTRCQSAQFIQRNLHYASGSREFLRQSAQPPWGSVYIVIHRQTISLYRYHSFSESRHVGRLNLGWKPAQLYVRLSTIPTSALCQRGNYKALSSSFHLFTYIYIYIYVCVCVCVCVWYTTQILYV